MGKSMQFTKTPMGDKPYYVYELSFPQGFVDTDGVDLSDVVFYVGMGTVKEKRNATQRIDEHEEEAKRARIISNKDKFDTVLRIWSQEMSIQKKIVFHTDSQKEALQEEARRIEQHSGPHLTNKVRPSVEPEIQYHPVFVITKEVLDNWPW